MAAPIWMSKNLSFQQICKAAQNRYNYSQKLRYASNAYFVVLPQMPPDTAETNACMRYTDLPDFPKVAPGNTVAACAKLSLEYELGLDQLNQSLADQSVAKEFDNVIKPIEELTVPLNYAHRVAKYFFFSHHDKTYQDTFPRVNKQVCNALNERWSTPTLYNSLKELHADRERLTPDQRSVVDMFLLEAKHSGIELSQPNRDMFFQFVRTLYSNQNEFRNKVTICRRLFSERLNFAQVKDMPKWLQRMMAEDQQYPQTGPWTITLQPHIYTHFMAYCSDRRSRWNAWQAHNNVASNRFQSQHLGNQQAMEAIQQARNDIGQCLGYDNYMDMSMQNKMAGSVSNVATFVEALRSKLRPVAEDEIQQLQDFADDYNFGHKLETYDIAYWTKQQADLSYNIDDDDLMQYFQLPKVLDGIFSLCQDLFGITFKECTGDITHWDGDVRLYNIYDCLQECSGDITHWDADVRLYNIYDEDGTHLSSFYLDPYTRPNAKTDRAWVEICRDRSEHMGTTPISFLNANLQPPVLKGQPPAMTFANVLSLFREFGNLLVQQLTKAPYCFISGQLNMEADSLPIMSYLMVRLAHHPNVLKRVSHHCETGESLNTDSIQRLNQLRTHMSAYLICRHLYLCAYDIETHTTQEHWLNIMNTLWDEYVPLPLLEEDHHPCSLTHVYSDQIGGACYSYLWAEMCAADIYNEFEQVTFEDKNKLRALGMRLHDTYLSHGGGQTGSEAFRKFRGRDPSVEYFLNDHTKGDTSQTVGSNNLLFT